MSDLAMAAMTGVCTELLKGQYNAAEIALDFGELEELLAKLIIGVAQDVQYDAATGRLMLVFVREP